MAQRSGRRADQGIAVGGGCVRTKGSIGCELVPEIPMWVPETPVWGRAPNPRDPADAVGVDV